MLPNTFRATMQPAVHPANDAEPRIARLSAQLLQLHVRTWTVMSAELFEMHAGPISSSPGMCLAERCGPGNLRLINGLFDCHHSRLPVPAIGAQIPLPEIGWGYLKQTHPQTPFSECSHYCELAKGLSLFMGKAVMNGRGGGLVDVAVSNLRL